MSNLNSCNFQGNLTADPELKGSGEKKVAVFTIAVNSGYGEYKTTAFINCVVLDTKGAENAVAHLSKGQQIIVNGRMVTNKWEDKESGDPRSRLELQLSRFDGWFFSGRKVDDGDDLVAASTEEEEPKLF